MLPRAKRPRTESTSLADNSDDDLFDVRPLQLPSFMTDNISVGGSSSNPRRGPTAFDQRPMEPMVIEDDQQDTHVTQLMRHWMNERLSPELLQHCGDLLQTLLDRIREQAWAPDANVKCFFC